MTAVTISSTRGASDTDPLNYTIETSAPTSNFDFELRYNLLDQNSVAITKKDLVLFIEAVIRGLESGGPLMSQFFYQAVNGSTDYVAPVL